MRIIAAFAFLLAVGAVGCSRKDAAADTPQVAAATNADGTAADAPAEAPPAEPAPAPDTGGGQELIAQDLSTIPETLQKQNYDGAMDTLTAAQLTAGTPEQVKAYREQLYRTLEYLQQKKDTDAKAAEAYEKLGRRTMGR
jgi:hypothetical protein